LEKISLQKIKWLRSLRNKKIRDDLSVFIVEGEKIVKELIEQFPRLLPIWIKKKFNPTNLYWY